MPAFTGRNMYLAWIYSGGTVTLQGDERTVNWTPSTDLAEATAGTDTRKQRLATTKDIMCSVSGRQQAGTVGNALEDALDAGVQGTIIFGPEGTATGKRRFTASAFSGGFKSSYKYADITEFSVDFSGDGVTYTKDTF